MQISSLPYLPPILSHLNTHRPPPALETEINNLLGSQLYIFPKLIQIHISLQHT